MTQGNKNHQKISILSIVSGLTLLIVFSMVFSACGGASSADTGSAASMNAPAHSASGSSSGASSQSQQYGNKSGSATGGANNAPPQYLIKSLNVMFNVKDTRQAAIQLQSWISATDPRSSSAGSDYKQVSDNLYAVSLTFTVQSTLYPRIYSYLQSYTAQNGGQLVSFSESVQDVTNDYVDNQSRLTNLRGEQQRLLTLMSQAQALNDILNIEQRLTDVEGQIEQIEAHLNSLNGQITFYTVAITLQPLALAGPAPAPKDSSWSPAQIWQGAVAAAVAVGQVLLTITIWLLVFSIYIVPLAVLGLGVRWLRKKRMMQRIAPKVAPVAVASTSSQSE